MKPHLAAAAAAENRKVSVIGERHRLRKLTANEKAIEEFFTRNLPQGWIFQHTDQSLSLARIAPVYIMQKSDADPRLVGNAELLKVARKKGTKTDCKINFLIERHDDTVLVRQKIRLYKEIRRDIEKTYDRLKLRHLCAGLSVTECSIGTGRARDAAQEYLTTRSILADKLEVTPLYRIGTLYLYPKKNQCVLRETDWYVANSLVSESARLFPFEAGEEIDIILRNMRQLQLWQ